jgi:replication factor A1
MAIKDLQARQGNVDIVVEVVDISPPREFQKFGRAGRVASATVKDETGSMTLSLWNEEVDKVKAGMKVHIKNGYVNEYQGERQLTAGRFGTLEVVSDLSSDVGEKIVTEDEKTEEEALYEEKEAPASEEELTEDEAEDFDVEEEDVK